MLAAEGAIVHRQTVLNLSGHGLHHSAASMFASAFMCHEPMRAKTLELTLGELNAKKIVLCIITSSMGAH